MEAAKPMTAREAALAEVEKEKFNEAKDKYKRKLKELYHAEKIVSNIKREIEELDIELGNS